MEASTRQVPLVRIRRHLGTCRFEHRAVADRAVADAHHPARYAHVHRGAGTRLAVLEHEHLASARVDDRQCPRCSGGERCECRDAGGRNVERERKRARSREADPHAREAAGADADRQRFDVA